jgi:hypothetical protein
MLFKDILDKKTQIMGAEFDRLFDIILKKQKHSGDLLLVLLNGFFDPNLRKWSDGALSPYTFGPNKEGHSEWLHYQFIHQYRTTHLAPETHPEFLKRFEWSPERSKEIEELREFEGTTIQLEMLVYLKIWEADSFIKRFYQLANLLNELPYDWHFKIAESSRDKDATGSRQDILRKLIRDRFKNEFPAIYDAFKSSYKIQVRNSIAHSNYSFLSRTIQLNNEIEGDQNCSLKVLGFDEWIDLFHDTMVIYNQYIKIKNKIGEYYSELANRNGRRMEVLITKKETVINQIPELLRYIPETNRWNWDKNEN